MFFVVSCEIPNRIEDKSSREGWMQRWHEMQHLLVNHTLAKLKTQQIMHKIIFLRWLKRSVQNAQPSFSFNVTDWANKGSWYDQDTSCIESRMTKWRTYGKWKFSTHWPYCMDCSFHAKQDNQSSRVYLIRQNHWNTGPSLEDPSKTNLFSSNQKIFKKLTLKILHWRSV